MPPTPTPKWKVPEKWSRLDRRLYLRIAKRKKSEHALGYCVIAVGAQNFYKLQTHLASRAVSGCGDGEEGEGDDVSTGEVSDGHAPSAADE